MAPLWWWWRAAVAWAVAAALSPSRGTVRLDAAPKKDTPPSTKPKMKIREVAQNRKARFDYEILETFEAGIELLGTEVKSCRSGQVSLRDGFAQVKGNTVWLHNVDIAKHASTGAYFQHEPKRQRRLLMHKRQARKLLGDTTQSGHTIVPLRFYFNENNLLKVQLALCKGKQKRDKRQDLKDRDDKKMLQRVAKGGY